MDSEGFGYILKKTREQNGLSLKQVAVAIKINAAVIENIEKENFDQLPKPVFTRGFVRTYCKYLDLDEEEILKKFDDQTNFTNNTAKRAEIEDDATTGKTPFFLLVSKTLIPLFIIGALVAAGYGVFLVTQKYQNEVSVVKTDDIQAIHTANENTTEPEEADTTVSTEIMPNADKADKSVNNAAKSSPATASTVLTTPAKPTESAIPEAEITQRLTLEPSAKTLVQIQIDDEEVQKIILRPDVNRTFQAKKRIKLSISDAGAVNIIYNRKDLGVLGILGQSLDLEFPDTKNKKQ